jgi:putative DNA primase/helicase
MSDTENMIATIIDSAEQFVPKDSDDLEPIDVSSMRREIERLAALTPIEYSWERGDSAERLNTTVTALDQEVKAAQRNSKESDSGQGRPLSLEDVEPWDDPVEGAILLDEIVVALRRYVSMSINEAIATALWAIHTYAFEAFTCSPRLAITSPEKGCGKTTLLDVLSCLVARPLMASNITAPAVFRTVEYSKPTLIVDEADTFLRDNDELRGVLNSGHRRGGQVIRVCGEENEPRAFSTYAPATIAMIGDLPDTLNDRSIQIRLRRRLPEEKIVTFRIDRTDDLKRLARMARRFADDNADRFIGADPEIPSALYNRLADNWRPPLAIADAAGGEWPVRARAAAVAICGATEDQSIRTQLLGDIHAIFADRDADRLPSQELVNALVSLEDRPWPDWKNGKPLATTGLARLLKPLSIFSGSKRYSDGTNAKGYNLSDFQDAFTRYLPAIVTTSQPCSSGDFHESESVTSQSIVTGQNLRNLKETGQCDAVTCSDAWEIRI